MANTKPPTTPPLGKGQEKKHIKEELPPKLAKALEEEGYKLPGQLLRCKAYKEQKLYRVVMSDGQRHEINYDGQWVSKSPSQRKKDAAAAKVKAAKAAKGE